jgi:hypothetical protein
MTSIERTAYPRFSRAPSVKELRELYTPTPHDIAFVTTRARGDGSQFALMILLKAFQRLGYFPNPQEIPGAVISYIRAVMNKLQDRAKEELETIRGRERATTEHLIDVFTDVLQTTTETPDNAEMGKGVRNVLDRSGGAASLLIQCEQVRAHHGNRHQPFIWRYYSSHRKVLFRFLKALDLRSTTQDQALMQAVAFILEHEQNPKKYLEASLDLSFASARIGTFASIWKPACSRIWQQNSNPAISVSVGLSCLLTIAINCSVGRCVNRR